MEDLIFSIIGYLFIWGATYVELSLYSNRKKWWIKFMLILIGGFLIDKSW